MTRTFDVTLTFSPDLPCRPEDPVPSVGRINAIENGDPCNVTRLDSHLHFGTHVDAPIHFVEGGADGAPARVGLRTE